MNSWLKLDNAGKLFPSTASGQNSSVFRVAVILKELVNPEILQAACDTTIERFPMFMVRLKKGIFWNYLETSTKTFKIQEEVSYPCKRISIHENNGYLLRVCYSNQRIAVEVFHALTDGSGATEFLKSLLYYYLMYSGAAIDDPSTILLVDDGINPDEYEDSFQKQAKKSYYETTKLASSYHIKGEPFAFFGHHVTHGVISVASLLRYCKTKGVTITAYLTATLMYAIYITRQVSENNKDPVVVSVPVNLRKVFPSTTLRNFFSVVNLGAIIDSTISRETLIKITSKQLTMKTDPFYLQGLIYQNVAFEENILAKFVPLFIKDFAINIGFQAMGEKKKTISLSNVGIMQLPADMLAFIEHTETVLYPTKYSPLNCGVSSVGDKLTISFARTTMEADVVQTFFSLLAQDLDSTITVYSNDWGNE